MTKLSLWRATIAMALVAIPTGAQAQEGGEGGGGGEGGDTGASIDLDVELDYSDSGSGLYDEDEMAKTQSTLLVGQAAKGQKYSNYLQMGTVQIGGGTGYTMLTPGVIPEVYVVQPGDTLLDISAQFFGTPDLWPEIWSLNPEITNPNWIYPGQHLNLVQAVSMAGAKAGGGEGEDTGPKIIVAARLKPGTVVFRNPGFIDKEIEEASGKIISAFEEAEYLSFLDHVYVEYEEGKTPAIGSTATVYRIEKEVKDPKKKKVTHGKLVRILGTVKVIAVDEEHRIATVSVTEAIDVIKRGDLVGPVDWKIATVAPVEGSLDLEGQVIATLVKPLDLVGSGHVVFIDLGYEDGVVEGNQLMLMRKGDPYLLSTGKKKKMNKNLPWEPIGKMMVLDALKQTSTCLVIESSQEAEIGDKVELRRGK